MSIDSRLKQLYQEIPQGVTLVSVSKFHPSDLILEGYNAGHRVFGESRVQELVEKQQKLPKDIQWHFIGSLQRNKVKQIAPFINLIHSMDSERLMVEIDKQAASANRVIDCLLQIHIAEEETKSGFTPEECLQFLSKNEWKNFKNIRFVGVMGMATFTEDEDKVRKEFQNLKKLFTQIKQTYFPQDDFFKEISMGMSGDYKTAIEEGSTMVRIGTYIFGNR